MVRASLIPGDDRARRVLTPEERAEARNYQERRRRELQEAALRGDIHAPVHGDPPPAWAVEIAEVYAARMGKPIGDDDERRERIARRLADAYSDDLSDLLVEDPAILRARARSAAIGFERSGEDVAVSAYLYGSD